MRVSNFPVMISACDPSEKDIIADIEAEAA